MLEIQDLRKEFGSLVAVDGLRLRARPGEIYGLLGPNGAGKSTTIGCVCGLLRPSGGRVRVDGKDVLRDGVAARGVIGIVPQELALYEDLSALANLEFWGGIHRLRGTELRTRIDEVLEAVGLADRARDRVREFSGGMKRRLNFACGLLHRPRLLLLDEPTAGVDPQSRAHLLELAREQARGGACVLYTTHYMEEAETLCDRIAVMDGGRILAEGTLEELRHRMGSRDLLRLSGRFEAEATRKVLDQHPELGEVVVVEVGAEALTLEVEDASRHLPALFQALASVAEVRETRLRRADLQTLFLKLTGKELRD